MATIIYDNETDNSYMSSSESGEWFKVRFDEDGLANFWINSSKLSNDIDLYVYADESTSSEVLGRSIEDPGEGEPDDIVWEVPVRAGVYYYVYVKNVGRGSCSYEIKAKNYPQTLPYDEYDLHIDDIFYKFQEASYDDYKEFGNEPPYFVEGQEIRFKVMVENLKGTNSPAYRLSVFKGSRELDYRNGDSLGGNSNDYHNLIITIDEPGEHDLKFIIEPRENGWEKATSSNGDTEKVLTCLVGNIDEEDNQVLNKVDRATVISLKKALVERAADGDTGATDAIISAIQKIRTKPEYRGKYGLTDRGGHCRSVVKRSSDREYTDVIIHAHEITKSNVLAHNSTIPKTGLMLMGLLPSPWKYLAAAIDLGTFTDPDNGIYKTIFDINLTRLGLQDGINGYFFAGIAYGSSLKDDPVKAGCYDVKLTFKTGNSYRNTYCTYANDLTLIRETYWDPVEV